MCRTSVSFLHVALGVLVPVLVATHVAPRGGGGAGTRLQRLADWGDARLRALAMAHGCGMQQVVAAWFIVTNVWLLCRVCHAALPPA